MKTFADIKPACNWPYDDNYLQKCNHCNEMFIGPKHSRTCWQCYDAPLDIKQIWMGARTTRYHTDPLLTGKQNNADHQWGVAVLVIYLCKALGTKPTADLLMACLFHDSAEFMVGDFPNPFKVRHPEFKKEHDKLEQKELAKLGASVTITQQEQELLKIADSLEAIILCSLHRPDYMVRPDWKKHKERTVAKAQECDERLVKPVQYIMDMVDMTTYKTLGEAA